MGEMIRFSESLNFSISLVFNDAKDFRFRPGLGAGAVLSPMDDITAASGEVD